jgi:hypothetical protein
VEVENFEDDNTDKETSFAPQPTKREQKKADKASAIWILVPEIEQYCLIIPKCVDT